MVYKLPRRAHTFNQLRFSSIIDLFIPVKNSAARKMKLVAAIAAVLIFIRRIDAFAPLAKNDHPVHTERSDVVLRMAAEEPKNGTKRKTAFKVRLIGVLDLTGFVEANERIIKVGIALTSQILLLFT
jgi:hypothetical protein